MNFRGGRARRAWPQLISILAPLGALLGGLAAACQSTVTLDFFPVESELPGGVAGAAGAPSIPGPGSLVVSGTFNVSRDVSPGRSCADGGDAVSYSVVNLAATSARLAAAPSDGCFASGDEVLLINVRGARGATEQVGSYELLRVASVTDDLVTFDAPKLNFYGASAGTDAGVGLGAEAQRVILQRLPVYSRLEVRAGAVLTADAWDGDRGGVLALRVLGESLIDGRVHMDAGGYRGGGSTDPVETTGTQGESVSGLGVMATSPNSGGGGGGLGDQTRLGCQQDGNPGGGGGHATPGTPADVMDLCEGTGAGAAGERYTLAGRLFFGSGGGSAGTDNVRVDNPPGGAGGAGGGIVWLLSGSITGQGSISSRGAAGVGDPVGVECDGGSTVDCYDHTGPGGGGAGGSVRLSAARIDLRSYSAPGGRGGNGNDTMAGNGGDGGEGRVLIDTGS